MKNALFMVLLSTSVFAQAFHWSPIVDAFGEYQLHLPNDGLAANTFAVPRVQAGAEAEFKGARARLLLEGVYATQGGALIGVAGDSLVVRLREAWGGYRYRFLEAELGLVKTLVIPEYEKAFLYRELAPDGLEQFKLKAPADFGAVVRAHLPSHYGSVAVSVTNGEGYAQRELNAGKNVELLAAFHPLPEGRFSPWSVVGSATIGTSGPSSSTANRFGAAMLWSASQFGAGFSAMGIQGFLDDGSRRGILTQAFARAELFDHLLLAGRLQYFARDLSANDGIFELLAAVGARVEFVEVFAALQRSVFSPAARVSLPGAEAVDIRLVVRARWPAIFEEGN